MDARLKHSRMTIELKVRQIYFLKGKRENKTLYYLSGKKILQTGIKTVKLFQNKLQENLVRLIRRALSLRPKNFLFFEQCMIE